MYGTRDAPMIWQDHLRETLFEMKFKESVTHPGLFQHETRDIFLCVHVENLRTGVRDDLMWLKKQLLRKYELETLLMGEDNDMVKKAVYLGRILVWGENGLRPDGRHVRSLLREVGMESCRSISTQLCTTVEKEGNRSGPDVSAELATKHWAAVAGLCTWPRIDWIWEWRQLSAKIMTIPREGDDERLTRVARFLHGQPAYLQW